MILEAQKHKDPTDTEHCAEYRGIAILGGGGGGVILKGRSRIRQSTGYGK
jgi:hypothetical protein